MAASCLDACALLLTSALSSRFSVVSYQLSAPLLSAFSHLTFCSEQHPSYSERVTRVHLLGSCCLVVRNCKQFFA